MGNLRTLVMGTRLGPPLRRAKARLTSSAPEPPPAEPPREGPRARQRREWQARGARDDAAMARIIATELAGGGNGVDVGAHVGDLLRSYLAASPDGHHVAIEPLPALAERLVVDFPQVSVHQCALSDTEGEATFYYLEDRPAWSGLRHQDAVGNVAATEITVPLAPLDTIVGDTPVALIKIDVEGAEMGVLRGSRSILRRDRPTLILEHARIHAKNFGTEPQEVWAFLDEHGYGVTPVAQPGRPLSLEEFVALCDTSEASGYDRDAVTNWLAKPR